MVLTQDLSLTRSHLTGTNVMMTFEEDLSLTRSLLTNLQARTIIMMTFEEVAATKRDPSQTATTKLYM